MPRRSALPARGADRPRRGGGPEGGWRWCSCRCRGRCLINHKIEPKRMQLISPFEGKEPNLVLIEARKNANSRLKIEKNLIVYQEPGTYTQDINSIYDQFSILED